MSALSAAKKHNRVDHFLDRVDEVKDDDDLCDFALRDIHGLIRYAKRFYIEFLAESYEVEIVSFTFRDKRKLARHLVKREAGVDGDDVPEPVTILAEFYEELVDQLHGDIEFGYSADLADFQEFHNDLYPNWLVALGEWLKDIDQVKLQEELWALADRYRDVASI